MLEVLFVVLHDELAGLLVERALGEGHYEETLDDLKDVVERPSGGVPILLERVDADLAFFGDVGMEDLRYEEAWSRGKGYPLED